LSRYLGEDYPAIGLSADDLNNLQKGLDTTPQDISFSGLRKNYCVSYVDLVNSTRIASQLSEGQIGTYYGVFLNSVAKIAKNFSAKIVKNVGDCLIYFFPKTSVSTDSIAFKQVIECGLTLLDARELINGQLYDQHLPTMDYRISADYGKLEMVKTSSARSKDFFGPAMNLCAKMNAKANPNSMVIGSNLFELARYLKGYHFKVAGSYSSGPESNYTIYSISRKKKQLTSNFSNVLQAKRALKNIGNSRGKG